ncbi:hypothetical protein ACFVFS_19445 [Kitasatospora sp. NPDC057692]|uniref:hypothetical protein n=1 Tax=Kitasatospora sp. NPDC057692 TaxID=3346215 RepID=UPI0036C5FB1C
MNREELHRTLSDSLVGRVAPRELAQQSTYGQIFRRYGERREYFKTHPGAVAKGRGGGATNFDPGAAVVLAAVSPYAMALLDQVLDHLIGKASESLGSRIWAWITRRRPTPASESAALPGLTPELLEEVRGIAAAFVERYDVPPHAANELIVEVVAVLLAHQQGNADGVVGAAEEAE